MVKSLAPVLLLLAGSQFLVAQDNPSPPSSPVKLVFVHLSVGENWLGDENGQLGIALRDNNYFVSDTNYGWGPDAIGDNTDIGEWYTWFRGPRSATYTAALFADSGQTFAFSRLATDPGGENQVVVFKSCFVNSAIQGGTGDPVPAIDSNPLRGENDGSPYMTYANARGIYVDLLNYFRTRPDKLFILCTTPPVADPAWSANARALNEWLVNDWLAGYPYPNVAVFDLYNTLTTNGGDPSINDLGLPTGNHHRFRGGAIERIADGDDDGNGNVLEYASAPDNDHPTQAGNLKATGEFLPLMNIFYNRWQAFRGSAPSASIVVGRGTYAADGGRMDVFNGASSGYSPRSQVLLPWGPYNAANGATRVAAGDVDGDGRDEIVAGLGTYTASGGWLCVFDDGASGNALMRWIRVPWSAYNAANGETRPAVGDVDGDGRDEIVVGLGSFTTSGGWLCEFDDASAGCAFLRWLRVPWAPYNAANGETNPAVGDCDGDGRDEVVVGLGTYTTAGGYACVFEDAAGGHALRRWMRVAWSAFNSANGEVLPALGDVDADGRDEIVLGLGSYPANGGWMGVYDDSSSANRFMQWLRVARSDYNAANGETRPSLGNVDLDASDEIVIGMGTFPADGGWAMVRDDAGAGFAPLTSVRSSTGAYNAANGETWTTVAR